MLTVNKELAISKLFQFTLKFTQYIAFHLINYSLMNPSLSCAGMWPQ